MSSSSRRAVLWVLLSALVAVMPAGAGEVARMEEARMPVEDSNLVIPNPPAIFHESGSYGRLRPDLRTAAAAADPLAALTTAAAYEYAHLTPDFHNPRWGLPRLFHETALAFADLAVSGRRSFDRLRGLDLTREQAKQLVRDRFGPQMEEWNEPDFDEATAVRAISRVVERGYDVAWALRGPSSRRHELRGELGWIAVSGEDDRPHRPVNVGTARYPQRDVAITVAGQRLVVRVLFIHPSLHDWRIGAALDESRLPPRLPHPPVTGDVLVYLHGHGSSAEEALNLDPHLFDAARQGGRELTLLSLDLPGYGYGSAVDTTRLPTLPLDTARPHSFLGMDLIESSIDAVIGALDRQRPGLRSRVVGVVGGSLGGNLGLRVASRDRRDFPWARNVVAWAPASVWPSFADPHCNRASGDVTTCTDGLRGDIEVAITQLLTGNLVGLGVPAVRLGELIADLDDLTQRALAVRVTHETALSEFDQGKRADFLSGGRLQPGAQFAFADKWYRDGWPCKADVIEAGKWLAGEYFGEAYFPWHWRIANEQLVFSHWEQSPSLFGPHRLFPKLLLLAAEDDDGSPEFLRRSALRFGAVKDGNYGRTVDLAATGHSVHAERPRLLSELIVGFVYEAPPAVIVASAL